MRALVMGLAAGLATLVVIARPDAQPSPPPDFAHAKELYDSANASMANGDFGDAVRDYGAAYDITHDPVLFFRSGRANEKAGPLRHRARLLRAAIQGGQPPRVAGLPRRHRDGGIRRAAGDRRTGVGCRSRDRAPGRLGSGNAESAAGSGPGSEAGSNGRALRARLCAHVVHPSPQGTAAARGCSWSAARSAR
jgi:hypothetical protein